MDRERKKECDESHSRKAGEPALQSNGRKTVLYRVRPKPDSTQGPVVGARVASPQSPILRHRTSKYRRLACFPSTKVDFFTFDVIGFIPLDNRLHNRVIRF